MKKYLLIIALAALTVGAKAQTKDSVKLYNPAADAKAEINSAVKQAAKEHKNVLLQIGGNWCIWCLRFNNLVTTDADLNKYMTDNYVVMHVNWSPENKNEAVLASLGYPQRFGFPVFIVLDDKGNRLHTQNSGYLEEGKGHSKAKVMEFSKHGRRLQLIRKVTQKPNKFLNLCSDNASNHVLCLILYRYDNIKRLLELLLCTS